MKITKISPWMNNPYQLHEPKKIKRKKNDNQNKKMNNDSLFISTEAKKLYQKNIQS